MDSAQYEDNFYNAVMVRVIDGDTFELLVDLGQDVRIQGHYRLVGLDAPETKLYKGVTPEEKGRGIELRDLLKGYLPPGSEVVIRTFKAGKYGRYLIDLWADIGPLDENERTHLNLWLLESGWAERS